MRRLIFITQHVDPTHPFLGTAAAQVSALARRVDEIVVLADATGGGAPPANVRVHLFCSDRKLGRGALFERALAAELVRRPRPLAVVAHMCPVYAVLAAPLARPLGVPVLLWYAHWKAHATLRLAELLSTRIVSTDAQTFPLPSRKVSALGQAIEVDGLHCAERPARTPLRLLVVGRYSPAKGIGVILRGVRLALDRGLDARLDACGTTSSAEEERHKDDLERLVDELGLRDRATLGGPVPHDRIAAVYDGADILVNNMRAGTSDKVVYEAAASCMPVIASNPWFAGLLDGIDPPLRYDRGDAAGLAERLLAVAALAPKRRSEIGRALRARVVESHSVDSWADGLIAVAEGRS